MQIYPKYGKRLLDCAMALTLLLLFAPAMVTIALLVRLFLGRPVLFAQKRPGKHERIFSLLKFRTLLPEIGPEGQRLSHEERLTRFGRILRASSLDELPQLVNVIRNEMSLIGPRPLLVDYLPYYSPEQRLRHSVLPGITGWAQVNGRNTLSVHERLAKDVEYSRKLSFSFDLKIIFLTVKVVVTQKGLEVSPTQSTNGFMESGAGSRQPE